MKLRRFPLRSGWHALIVTLDLLCNTSAQPSICLALCFCELIRLTGMSIGGHIHTRPGIQLSSRSLAKLDRLGLYSNLPEPAIICKECGFAITADKGRVSRYLGENHNVEKSARRRLNQVIRLLNLPDPRYDSPAIRTESELISARRYPILSLRRRTDRSFSTFIPAAKSLPVNKLPRCPCRCR